MNPHSAKKEAVIEILELGGVVVEIRVRLGRVANHGRSGAGLSRGGEVTAGHEKQK
jgi:hypothetical protein